MDTIVSCKIENGIAHIKMDDGKSNVVSPNMVAQLNNALDQAERANAVVILTGREDIFSAGFDLKILKTGVANTFKMLIGGFALSKRLLAFPTPVIIACNGHTIAMGVFLLLSGDYRVGIKGDFKIVANEVEIGLTMPYTAIEVCRQRLTPANFNTAVLLSELYDPQSALEAGFFDKIVESNELIDEVQKAAERFLKLDLKAHKESKQRMRKDVVKAVGRAIWADAFSFVGMGVKRALGSK